eukprot:Skav213319  [mRNA]  locus=scaffold1383:272814:273128:- [translate_table: standard]
MRHESCNHSKGLFCIKKRIKGKTCLIHTGGIDGMWRLSKAAIPASLATRVKGQRNHQVMRSIRVWQWRWFNSKQDDLLRVTKTLEACGGLKKDLQRMVHVFDFD